MQDNTLARALRLAGADAVLVPTYTPIRVDEEDVSTSQVFLGGVNIYLDSMVPGWRRLPGWMIHWLNRPSVLKFLTRFSSSTDAQQLGPLTLDMLKGIHGPQRREIHEFVDYLCQQLQPDVIIFSNALLSGVLTELRSRFSGKILCLLQGDDIFLEGLTEPWKQRVLQQLKSNCDSFDGFLTHSRYYRDFMSAYLQLSPDRFAQIPLTIDVAHIPFPAAAAESPLQAEVSTKTPEQRRFNIGYFARICREKGVHRLLAAAAEVLPEFPNVELTLAGYLSPAGISWFENELAGVRKMAPGRIHWCGSPETREQKFEIIQDFDLLCIPTEYQEPKGLYVLEAAAVGVPALLPQHGAFPELVEQLQVGQLFQGSTSELAESLRKLIRQHSESGSSAHRQQLRESVCRSFGIEATSTRILSAIKSLCENQP